MKFQNLLETNVIDEWKEYYISYDLLLSTISSVKRQVFGTDALLDDDDAPKKHKCCSNLFRLNKNSDDLQYSSFMDIHRKKLLQQTIMSCDGAEQKYSNIRDDESAVNIMNDVEYNDNDNSNYKSIAVKHWENTIHSEADKINEFYLSIQQQLFHEYKTIVDRLDKLHQKYKKKEEKIVERKNKSLNSSSVWQNIFSSPNTNFSSTSFSDLEHANNNNLRARNKTKTSSNTLLLEPLNIPKSTQSKDLYLQQMKMNIFVLYQRFIVLSNFCTLNQIGFNTLVNKFNTELKCDTNTMDSYINKLDFTKSTKCNEYMDGLIQSYSNIYESGDYNHGKVRILNSISWSNTKQKWINNDKSIFWIGTKFGIMFCLIFWTILALITMKDFGLVPNNVVYVYRSCGVMLAWIWFWSFDIYIWSNKRINFVFIFDLNPRTRLTFLQYFDVATSLSVIYFFNIVLFLQTFHLIGEHYAMIWPTSLFIFYMLRLILPLFDNWTSRKIILNAMFNCLTAPFSKVDFADFFMADVLTSLSKVFVDIYMAACIITLNEYHKGSICSDSSSFTTVAKPLLICAPYWFRFMQCVNRYYVTGKRIPNGANALKYGLSLSVTLLGSFHSEYSKADFDGDEDDQFDAGRIVWLIVTLSSTFYLIFWDLKMDWALFPCNKRIKSYPVEWYYFAAINDCILRFFWTFTLFPTGANPYFADGNWHAFTTDTFLAFIEIAEVFRRGVWSIFRVEKAHLGQKDEFRRYQYIPLFYENNSLISNSKQKKSKPTTMVMEAVVMCILLVVIAIFIVLTKD